MSAADLLRRPNRVNRLADSHGEIDNGRPFERRLSHGREYGQTWTGDKAAVEFDGRGYIATDAKLAASIPGVFAGGDIVTGSATVISAMGAGKRAAADIDKFLKS